MRRWTPDLDFRPSASFISSKDGQTPDSPRRLLMNNSSSCCFLVSIASSPRLAVPASGATHQGWNKTQTSPHVLVWFPAAVKLPDGLFCREIGPYPGKAGLGGRGRLVLAADPALIAEIFQVLEQKGVIYFPMTRLKAAGIPGKLARADERHAGMAPP